MFVGKVSRKYGFFFVLFGLGLIVYLTLFFNLASIAALYADSPDCPEMSPELLGPVQVDMKPVSLAVVDRNISGLSLGGEFFPTSCTPRQNVAVIIPFRNRTAHLALFLKHLHPILQRQQIHYRIFVVNQTGTITFNRGMLFNAGFKEARKVFNWDCYIFHDVDKFPENDKNLYTCGDSPKLLTVFMDFWNYKIKFKKFFGGATALTAEHYKAVNGFPNQFWGWGGEDNDFGDRVRSKYNITKDSTGVARYSSIKHSRDHTNPDNPDRFLYLKVSCHFQRNDGLNNLRYQLLKTEMMNSFTDIQVFLEPVPVYLPPKDCGLLKPSLRKNLPFSVSVQCIN